MTDKVRVLALSPVPEEGAGCRFRIAQYIPLLAAAGFEVTIDPFLNAEFFRILYERDRYARKVGWFLRRSAARLRTLGRSRRYDLFFVYREAFPLGPPLFESVLAALDGRPLVYDFDDAIFLPNASEANSFVRFLKHPQKVSSLIRKSDRVIAGNAHLASYARRYNPAVAIIPTCVDTTRFVPRAEDGRGARLPLVGWIGTPTTSRYLEGMVDVVRKVAARHTFVLRVSGAGRPLDIPGVAVANEPWTLAREVELFNGCDVGLYPLPDDEWAKGKCGFKAIQFMACGVPVVASAVGMNGEFIQDGVNGFLASTEAEWVDRLEWLLADPALRQRLGRAGRQTIVERYSLRVQAPRLISVLDEALGRAACRASDEVAVSDRGDP